MVWIRSRTRDDATRWGRMSDMADALTLAQVQALADDLRSLLDKVEAGDLDATTAMRYRLQGAVAVLEVVQGRGARFEPEAE